MAYYETIYLVQGDTLPEIQLQLKDSNTAATNAVLDPDDNTTWAPIDISDAVVRIKMRALGSTTVSSTILCIRVAPYTDGNVTFTFDNSELATAGVFEGEIEITYTNGTVQTVYDKLKFSVREQF